MEFYGTIHQGRIVWPRPVEGLRKRYLLSLKEGVQIRETITKQSQSKTWKQIKTIFGLVINTILGFFNDNGWDSSILLNTEKPTGISVSKDLLKEYLYGVCPIFDDEGNRITLRNATIENAMKFINDVRDWAASQWGICVPDPDPNWREQKRPKKEQKDSS